MRDIKFRAWDSVRKLMIVQAENSFKVGLRNSKSGNEISIEHSTYIDNFFTPEMGDLMQYTGLKDKNGVEIYESDIIKTEWQNREGEIVFILGSFSLKTGIETTPLELLVRNKWKLEIVGNKYEQ